MKQKDKRRKTKQRNRHRKKEIKGDRDRVSNRGTEIKRQTRSQEWEEDVI